MEKLRKIINQIDASIRRARRTVEETNSYEAGIRAKTTILKFETLAINLKRAKRDIEKEIESLKNFKEITEKT
jgi:hypothetical protein